MLLPTCSRFYTLVGKELFSLFFETLKDNERLSYLNARMDVIKFTDCNPAQDHSVKEPGSSSAEINNHLPIVSLPREHH